MRLGEGGRCLQLSGEAYSPPGMPIKTAAQQQHGYLVSLPQPPIKYFFVSIDAMMYEFDYKKENKRKFLGVLGGLCIKSIYTTVINHLKKVSSQKKMSKTKIVENFTY